MTGGETGGGSGGWRGSRWPALLLAGAASAAVAAEPFERALPEQTEWWRASAAAAESRGQTGAAARSLARVCWLEATTTLRQDPPSCGQAVARAHASGDAETLAWALALRGNARLWTGLYEAAWADLEAALAAAPQASAARAAAEISRAGALLEGGDFDGAFASLERALSAARAADDVEQEAWAEIWRARVWALLGAEGAAVEGATAGRALARQRGDLLAESSAEWALGLAHLETGDWEAALAPVGRGLALARAARSWITIWLLERALAEALVGLGRLDEAASHLAFLERSVDAGTAPPPFAAGVAELRGRAELAAGRAGAAAIAFERAAAAAVVAPIAERAQLGVARALAAAGRPAEAIAAYRRAIEGIEKERAQTTLEELRIHFLTTRSDTYRELAALLVAAPDGAARAFAVAEAGRARALADQRAQAGIGAAITEPVSAAEVRARLDPDSALIEFVVTRDATWALLVGAANGAEVESIALPGAGPAAELAVRVDYFRRRVREAERSSSLVPAGRRLWLDLLAPVVARLAPTTRRLLVVPDGPLFRLPFAALVADEAPARFAIERFELALAPAAGSALPRARSLPGRLEALVVTHGDAAGPPAASRAGREPLVALRWAGDEGRRVARALGAGAVRLDGAAANEAAVRARALERRPILHFATHAVIEDAVPSRSALHLAASPGDDGWLRATEILRLPLAPGLVVLSACRSGDGPVAGGEGPLSLARAFLGAGAATVAATSWELDDFRAVGLVERFHRELVQGARADAALAAAIRRAIARGERPAVWAAFALWGEPGIRFSGTPAGAGWALLLGAAGALLAASVGVRRARRGRPR